MFTHNGTADNERHAFDGQIDALKASVKKLIDQLAAKPEASRLRTIAGKATEAIKAHPVTAVVAALGLGYLVVRIARR